MALAVRASDAFGQLGVDGEHARLDWRADRRVRSGKGEACGQLASSVLFTFALLFTSSRITSNHSFAEKAG
jgi:hypothetical protein